MAAARCGARKFGGNALKPLVAITRQAPHAWPAALNGQAIPRRRALSRIRLLLKFAPRQNEDMAVGEIDNAGRDC